MITFLWPLAFLLLPLPFIARRFLSPADPGLSGALRVPFFRSLIGGAQAGTRSERTSFWKLVFASVIWALLVTALARPALVGDEIPIPAVGRDVMMAIDLSGSMDQQDFAVGGRPTTRLGVVKETADTFVENRTGDRIGLVLFSDRAYLQAPLTFDRDAVRALLDEAQVGLTGQQTAIGDAIAISLKRLKDRPESSRVLILLTDGASNAGVMEPLKAADLANELGIKIYTIGVGAQAKTVSTAFGPQTVNPSHDLDENTLRQIAERTGGQYFRAVNVDGLAQIYREIDRLEPVTAEPVHIRPEVALYYWPASAALVLAGLFALIVLTPGAFPRRSFVEG